MVVTGSESPIVVVLRLVCISAAFFAAFAFQLVIVYQVNCKVIFVEHKTQTIILKFAPLTMNCFKILLRTFLSLLFI